MSSRGTSFRRLSEIWQADSAPHRSAAQPARRRGGAEAWMTRDTIATAALWASAWRSFVSSVKIPTRLSPAAHAAPTMRSHA